MIIVRVTRTFSRLLVEVAGRMKLPRYPIKRAQVVSASTAPSAKTILSGGRAVERALPSMATNTICDNEVDRSGGARTQPIAY